MKCDIYLDTCDNILVLKLITVHIYLFIFWKNSLILIRKEILLFMWLSWMLAKHLTLGFYFFNLLSKHVPLLIIRILCFLYPHQIMCIRWGNTSAFFTVSNGVKQGAILSPVYLMVLWMTLIPIWMIPIVEDIFVINSWIMSDIKMTYVWSTSLLFY